MLRASLTTLALLLAVPRPAVAQTAADRTAIEAAAMDYIEGFYTGDSTRLVRSVWPEVRKYGYYREPGSATYGGSAMPYDAFMRFARSVREGRNLPPAGAPKEVRVLDAQDQTAAVKVRAWWGTDYLLLAREGGRWQIVEVLWQSAPPGAGSAP
jgi:hypothetical protein